MESELIREVMSSPVIVVEPKTTVPAATALMKKYRIRHLPVVNNGQLVGIVSRGDLREASTGAAVNADSYELNFMLNRLTVERVMTRNVYQLAPDDLVVKAGELMIEHKIAGLPVVDAEGAVIGIVSELDLVRLLVRKLHECCAPCTD
jgi:CBS-domain-containing membrane protein